MKILHYSLGFPPFRKGGLTKYCMDLVEQEIIMGNDVSMLWPGKIDNLNKQIKIKKNKDYIYSSNIVCKSYEMINPMPVPLLNGIKDINPYIKSRNIEYFCNWFKSEKFEIVHIHTLMGLPRECVDFLKNENIKIVLTTHDYYGLCPKGSLFFNNQICNNFQFCSLCNESALSISKIKLLQNPLYKKYKDSKLIKYLRKKNNSTLVNKVFNINEYVSSSVDIENYKNLMRYYVNIFNRVDIIHFNSELTRNVYDKYIDNKKQVVIPITNKEISNNRIKKNIDKIVNFSYFGSCTDRKGFFFLIKVLNEVEKKYPGSFKLHIYSNCTLNYPYLVKHERYNYNQLKQVMDQSDAVLVPSLWYETFGFSVLESMSYSVPVIASERVGAKDLIKNYYNGIIVKLNENSFVNVISSIIEDKSILSKMNLNLYNEFIPKTMLEHTKQILKLYNSVVGRKAD